MHVAVTEGECKRKMLKLSAAGTQWQEFSNNHSSTVNLSYFAGMKSEEQNIACSFVVSGLTTSRYGSLYIKGESRAWDRRSFMDDFMDDPFDYEHFGYGGTDEDDYDDYPFFDDYDDYYGSDY